MPDSVAYEMLDSRRIKRHLLRKLADEWRGDPSGPVDLALISRCRWSTAILKLTRITLAKSLIRDTAFMRRLRRRAEDQVQLVRKRSPIAPLVVIGESNLLYDGYARYFALKKLGLTEAAVYRGVEK